MRAASLALGAVQAPFNACAGAYGMTAAAAACGGAAYSSVRLSERLRGTMALAPGADRCRIILYFHGGRLSLTTHAYREFIGRLSAATQACVVAVDYRKPPRARFPAGLEDALAAWRWAREEHPEASVAVAGDTLGANVAFSLVVLLAQRRETQPVACIGISPWLCLDLPCTAANAYGKLCAKLYLGSKRKATSAANPLVTIVNADMELARRFPPILMHAGKHEVATEDVREMADLCEDADQPAEIRLYACPRSFQIIPGFPLSSRDSLGRIDKFLQRHWQDAQPLPAERSAAAAAAPAARTGAWENRSKKASHLVANHLLNGFAAVEPKELSEGDILKSLRRSATVMTGELLLAEVPQED